MAMLPAPLQELWSAWSDIQGNAEKLVMVNVVGPAGEVREGVRQLLLANGGKAACVRAVELGSELPPEADLQLVVLDPAFGPTSSQATTLRKLGAKNLVLLMVGGQEVQFEARRREVASAVGARVEQVVAVKALSQLPGVLAKRLVALHGDHAMALARQFPFMRDEVATREVQATSQQNAMVGAMPLPGADLPVMTANQIKMVLRLAIIYDQPMTYDRLKEVLAIVGSGFALRSAARQLAKLIPGPGWIVAGGLGYGGTLALGRGAMEYFKRASGMLPASKPDHARGKPGRDGVIDAEATVVDPADATPRP